MAQDPLPRQYSYDAAGNRTSRKVVPMQAPLLAPPPPAEPEYAATEPVETGEELTFLQPAQNFAAEAQIETEELASLMPPSASTTPEEARYFVEKIAQMAIKVYPNPTTEKITLEISNMENLQTGVFRLFSLTGQLLQEQPVHSATTVVSLAGLSKGSYILKVHINDVTEDWKIIKQ